MTKEISLIYQDCFDCEPYKEWYRSQMKIAEEQGFAITEIPHNFPGAKGLILQARSHGQESLPFFTDGVKFTRSLKNFIEKPRNKRGKKDKDEVVSEKE